MPPENRQSKSDRIDLINRFLSGTMGYSEMKQLENWLLTTPKPEIMLQAFEESYYDGQEQNHNNRQQALEQWSLLLKHLNVRRTRDLKQLTRQVLCVCMLLIVLGLLAYVFFGR